MQRKEKKDDAEEYAIGNLYYFYGYTMVEDKSFPFNIEYVILDYIEN